MKKKTFPLLARKKLLDIEDRTAKICIGYGEGRILKYQFDKACKKLNKASRTILKKSGLVLLAIGIVFLLGWTMPETICPDCNQHHCIYQAIDKLYDQSDMDLERAIYLVCGERGIKDSVTIDLIKANYGL